jgi:hypothetical protein
MNNFSKQSALISHNSGKPKNLGMRNDAVRAPQIKATLAVMKNKKNQGKERSQWQ